MRRFMLLTALATLVGCATYEDDYGLGDGFVMGETVIGIGGLDPGPVGPDLGTVESGSGSSDACGTADEP